MAPLKFGFHNFLNAEPLLATLLKREKEGGFQIVLDSPAGVARRLGAGELDLGMIPSVAYLGNKTRYRLLDHFAITSRGPVDSVLLIAKKELENVESVALDAHSMTSSKLIKILFLDRFPKNVSYETLVADPVKQLKIFDAVLVIGDKAFSARRHLSRQTIFDLSAEWFRKTEKPFVHAVLAVRRETELSQFFLKVLEETQTRVEESIQEIAQKRSASFEMPPSQLQDYLRNKICYVLDSSALAGLDLFNRLCEERSL